MVVMLAVAVVIIKAKIQQVTMLFFFIEIGYFIRYHASFEKDVMTSGTRSVTVRWLDEIFSWYEGTLLRAE